MNSSKYDTDIRHFDKKNKVIKADDGSIDIFDDGGYVVKHYPMTSNLNGCVYKKIYGSDGRLKSLIKSHYSDGMLSGLWEFKKFAPIANGSDVKLIQLERALYDKNKLNGFKEVKKYDDSIVIYNEQHEYSLGVKNGPFNIIDKGVIIDGIYIDGKLDGTLSTVCADATKDISIDYSMGKMIAINKANIKIGNDVLSFILTGADSIVWRSGTTEGDIHVVIKCKLFVSTLFTPYIPNTLYHRVDRLQIVDIINATIPTIHYDTCISTMKGDNGTEYILNQIVTVEQFDSNIENTEGVGIYVYKFKQLCTL